MASLLDALPAYAACSQVGTTITCSGASAPLTAVGDGLNVTVQPGATLTIPGNGQTGLTLNNLNDPVTNNGIITSTRNGVTGILMGDNNGLGTGVVNNGTFSFTGTSATGISVGNNNVITNNNTMSFTKTGSEGIAGGNNNQVTNNGTITTNSTSRGIDVFDNNVIFNNNTISGTNAVGLIAADSNNQITNNGQLTDSAAGQGISANDGNTIVNSASGQIKINGAGQGITAENTAGTISPGIINNAGTISVGNSGFGRTAVGINAFQNYTINNSGTVTFGSNADGIDITQNNTINNTKTIISATGATGGNGVHVLGGTGNMLTNSGAITSNGVGVLLDTNSGLTLNNSGSINATSPSGIGISVNNSNLTVTNSGTIAGDANGIFAADTASPGPTVAVTNAAGGTISSATGGVAISIGNTYIGNITNNSGGTISGGANAIWGNTGSTLTVDNAGVIKQTDADGAAIAVNGTGNIFNRGGGTITANGAFSTGVDLGTTANNSLTNAGTITANGIGVNIQGNNTTVSNSGTITSAASNAVVVTNLSTGSTIVNASGGLISANADNARTVFGDSSTTYSLTNAGTISAMGAASFAVWLDSFSSATNSGTINAAAIGIFSWQGNNTITNTSTGMINVAAGGLGIASNSTGDNILNAGTITGGAGAVGINVASSNQIKNSGTISIGLNGTGVQLSGSGNQVDNSGTIKVLSDSNNTGFSILVCGLCAPDSNTINNLPAGVLDGKIAVFGTNNVLNNAGWITITDPNTPIGQFTFALQGSDAVFNPNIYNQTSTGTLAVRVTNTGNADSLIADRVIVAGTLRATIQPQLYPNTLTTVGVVDITSAAGDTIHTTFDRFTASSPFFTATPIYDTGDPTNYSDLKLQLNRVAFNAVPGETRNQQAVGNVLESGYSTSLTGAAATFFSNLFVASTVGVLDNLSGEGTAALQNASIGAGSQFNNATLGQLVFGDTSGTTSIIIPPPQYAATPKPRGADAFASVLKAPPGRWRLWTAGLGGYRSIDGNAFPIGSANQTIRNYGGAFGFDYQAAPDLLVGFAAGGSEANVSVPDRSTTGRLTGGHFGVYGLKTWGAAYLAASANYARFDNSTTRTIAGVGPTENAAGNFASDQLSARLELGWKRAFANYTLTPFVAIEPAALWSHGYTETSTTVGGAPGVLGLSFAARTTTSLPTFLGVQADTRIVFANGAVVSPYARASWVHEFEPSRQITATFVSLPTGAFTVDGARPARDSGRLDAGSKVQLDTTRSLFANVSGEWSGISQSYSATAGLKVALQ